MLRVVGLGPGDASLIAPMAWAALAEAEVLAGYARYLALVPEELKAGKIMVSTGMTGEMARCETAIDHALAGRATAVVCGGDAGVYGLAGLVLELAQRRGVLPGLEVEVVPGVPALAAAAALLGAPLTHDFACVSLSDLLTPWLVIEKRLACAAEGDFVLVLYNPRSGRRRWQLERAFQVLAESRSPDTPVGLVRQAFRPGQEVRVFSLAEADPAWADMLSILMVGNSQTRQIGGRMVTPRGYLEKYGPA